MFMGIHHTLHNLSFRFLPNLQLEDRSVDSGLFLLGVEQVDVPLGVVCYRVLLALSLSLNPIVHWWKSTHSCKEC